jgi:hypothetical protein
MSDELCRLLPHEIQRQLRDAHERHSAWDVLSMRTNRRKSILTDTGEFNGLFCVAILSVTHGDFIRKQFETATNRPKNIPSDDSIDRVFGTCLQRSVGTPSRFLRPFIFDPQTAEQIRDLIEHSQRFRGTQQMLPLPYFSAGKPPKFPTPVNSSTGRSPPPSGESSKRN